MVRFSFVLFTSFTATNLNSAAANNLTSYSAAALPLRDIRFNKLPPNEEENRLQSEDYVHGVHRDIYPMVPNDYPFTGNDITKLSDLVRNETYADSVVLPGDIELKEDDTAEKWLVYLPDPIYPGDTEGKYWGELQRVVDAQMKRRRGELPSDLSTWPKIWEEFDLADIAEAVSSEYPVLHQQTFIKTVFKDGIEMLQNSQPFRSKRDFVGTEIRVADINTWTFHAVAPINFMLKWHFGMPRPEEMAWLISSGKLTSADDGIPEDIVGNVKSHELREIRTYARSIVIDSLVQFILAEHINKSVRILGVNVSIFSYRFVV